MDFTSMADVWLERDQVRDPRTPAKSRALFATAVRWYSQFTLPLSVTQPFHALSTPLGIFRTLWGQFSTLSNLELAARACRFSSQPSPDGVADASIEIVERACV
jgi:hypothetical protein